METLDSSGPHDVGHKVNMYCIRCSSRSGSGTGDRISLKIFESSVEFPLSDPVPTNEVV